MAANKNKEHTSYCSGWFLAWGSDRTETHLFLSKDFTSSTRLSLIQLYKDKTDGHQIKIDLTDLVLFSNLAELSIIILHHGQIIQNMEIIHVHIHYTKQIHSLDRGIAYLWLALAVQYLRALSGSLTRPSRQHWAHANFILRFGFRLRSTPTPLVLLIAPPTAPNEEGGLGS